MEIEIYTYIGVEWRYNRDWDHAKSSWQESERCRYIYIEYIIFWEKKRERKREIKIWFLIYYREREIERSLAGIMS